MFHQKKDYLLTLIEKLGELIAQYLKKQEEGDVLQTKEGVQNSFAFYRDNFDVTHADTVNQILDKLPAIYFIDEYARLLVYKYNLEKVVCENDREDLSKALLLIEYLKSKDKTFSWDREVLFQDILRLLDKN